MSDTEKEDFQSKILDNKYMVLYQIGTGEFSEIWLSLNIDDKKYYAIKIHNDESFEFGEKEDEILRMIKDVKTNYFNKMIKSFIYDDLYYCIVYELMAGSLYDIMKKQYPQGYPENIIKKIYEQLKEALNLFHISTNMIHSDIKPENILVKGISNKHKKIIEVVNKNYNILVNANKSKLKKNKKKALTDIAKEIIKIINKIEFDDDKIVEDEIINNMVIKLSDFGTCINLDNNEYKLQTKHYRAPEIIFGTKYDQKIDLWSIGCMVYELVTGEILFNPNKSSQICGTRYHVMDMIILLGKIPDKLICGKYTDIYLKKNGRIKGVYTFEIDNEKYDKFNNSPIKKYWESLIKYDSDKRYFI